MLTSLGLHRTTATLNTDHNIYLSAKHAMVSTDEVLDQDEKVKLKGLLAIIEIRFFTKYPVNQTMKKYLKYANINENLATRRSLNYSIKIFLPTCTTETPFRHSNGVNHCQIEDVSMDLLLGP